VISPQPPTLPYAARYVCCFHPSLSTELKHEHSMIYALLTMYSIDLISHAGGFDSFYSLLAQLRVSCIVLADKPADQQFFLCAQACEMTIIMMMIPSSHLDNFGAQIIWQKTLVPHLCYTLPCPSIFNLPPPCPSLPTIAIPILLWFIAVRIPLPSDSRSVACSTHVNFFFFAFFKSFPNYDIRMVNRD
jgi:hypothetical protein